MNSSWFLMLAADAILLLHVLFVAFVVVGLVVIIIGRLSSWSWIRNPWFRATHLGAIAVVVVQSWLGVICPLTTWEMSLRTRAGDVVYPGSFVSHWVETLLYHRAPDWFFILCYTVCGGIIVAVWIWAPPRSFFRR